MKKLIIVLAIMFAWQGAQAQFSGNERALKKKLLEEYGHINEKILYYSNSFDLNNDGKDEIIAYMMGRYFCGSGGCSTIIFEKKNNNLIEVAYISLTNPPIMAVKSKTMGWHDIIVTTSGDAAYEGGKALLKFDGNSYPYNPTTESVKLVEDFWQVETLVGHIDGLQDARK